MLERLLLKGSIVVKKAYCDWDRYKEFKPTMHEAAFELIEIPHVRQSGKNSADIRMVVDALDLCYTKEHVDTFVIISGDSDFSPLVSKLRENAKTVIGVGVKNSHLGPAHRQLRRVHLLRRPRPRQRFDQVAPPAPGKEKGRSGEEACKDGGAGGQGRGPEEAGKEADRRDEAIDLVLETAEALFAEGVDRVWGSMVKQTLKRRRPGFNESFYGFRSFSDLVGGGRRPRRLGP